MFERSHVPLYKWFQACFLRAGCEYRVNAHQLHMALLVTYKTALWMVHRLDQALDGAGADLGTVNYDVLRPPPQPQRRSRRFHLSTSGAIEIADEVDDMPWAISLADPHARQFAVFVEMAQRLHASEDAGKFDEILKRIVLQKH